MSGMIGDFVTYGINTVAGTFNALTREPYKQPIQQPKEVDEKAFYTGGEYECLIKSAEKTRGAFEQAWENIIETENLIKEKQKNIASLEELFRQLDNKKNEVAAKSQLAKGSHDLKILTQELQSLIEQIRVNEEEQQTAKKDQGLFEKQLGVQKNALQQTMGQLSTINGQLEELKKKINSDKQQNSQLIQKAIKKLQLPQQ